MGRLLPSGIAEAVLALYVLAAWIDIDLYGPRTATDVMFLVAAEGGLIGLGGIAGVLASSRTVQDGLVLLVHLGLWSTLLARWIFETIGWVAMIVVVGHMLLIYAQALRDESAAGDVYRRHYIVPMAVLAIAITITLLVPLPYGAWSTYSVPPAARILVEDAPFGIPNWFPATGFLYFAGLAAIRLIPWRHPVAGRSAS